MELKSSWTFLSIKHSQGTKSKNVFKQSRSSFKKLVHICTISKLLKMNYKCQFGGMCVHLRFHRMWYVLSCKRRWWWASLHFSWIFWIFLIVLGSTYEGGIESALGVDSASFALILTYRFLPKDLWIFLGWGVASFCVEMLVQYVVRLPRTWI